MPYITNCNEIFEVTTPCDKKTHVFYSEKQEQLWVKLHCKKCEQCRNAMRVTRQLNSVTTHGKKSINITQQSDHTM